ncbi:MAG: cytochrome c1 [Pseudomonadales bacterium]|nr:cytochrome c1 [Pseudomonadales bacterium]
MKNRLVVVVFLSLFSAVSWASSDGVVLEHMEPNLADKASLQKGAKTYLNYCFGCHSTKYARYERIADDLQIPHELFMENLVFSDAKIGELMDIAMPAKSAKSWFGATPPDLTLVTRLRGVDWLYSYLKGFYQDESRPWGVNNKIFPDVGMPHVLHELQGIQVKDCGDAQSETDHDACTDLKLIEGSGTLSAEEYDQVAFDLVNFLHYMGDPSREYREALGVKVLIFIFIFFIFAWFLNREFWKDIH